MEDQHAQLTVNAATNLGLPNLQYCNKQQITTNNNQMNTSEINDYLSNNQTAIETARASTGKITLPDGSALSLYAANGDPLAFISPVGSVCDALGGIILDLGSKLQEAASQRDQKEVELATALNNATNVDERIAVGLSSASARISELEAAATTFNAALQDRDTQIAQLKERITALNTAIDNAQTQTS